MGKGQKNIQTQAETRSTEQYGQGTAAQKRLVEGSPEFQARRANVAARRKAISAGDLRNASDFISNSARVAERERDRETRSNLLDTGVAGLASNYADPTQVTLAKQMNKDEFARDSAAQTEADANQYMQETSAMESDLINQQINVDSGIMGQAFGTSQNNLQLASQIAASRASILPSILSAAIGGFAGMATGGNWFSRGAGGGAGGGGGAAAVGGVH